eukprot:NODE_12638_length_1212_cov_12.212903.p1 GENE.NODE_12638_length_1212_cov_12.212903~~NODE_12638_length_1212_cov_12.212903.p1  ORF type:complete len:246 (+),score=37.50 NODE_12638_length_1212_cov_12.212903:103-840(+)
MTKAVALVFFGCVALQPIAATDLDDALRHEEERECKPKTGGTCRVLKCHASRNAVCEDDECVCREGECAAHGTCLVGGVETFLRERRAKLCYLHNERWTGAYYISPRVSVETCHETCQDDARCLHFSYSTDGKCSLHTTGAIADTGVDANGFISGPRNCIFSSSSSVNVASSAGFVGETSSMPKWVLWLIVPLLSSVLILVVLLAVVLRRSSKEKASKRSLTAQTGDSPLTFSIRSEQRDVMVAE